MTKCLLKALKAVDLQNHIDLFRSLGYDSAGALAHFYTEHFKRLNFTEQELIRFHALLDVLKEATREGKICPHYSKSPKPSILKSSSTRAKSSESLHHRNSQSLKITNPYLKKQSDENLKPKRSVSSIGTTGRLSSSHTNGFISQRSTSNLKQNINDQQFFGPKSVFNRPNIEHVQVKSYNYGVPTTKRPANSAHRVHYQNEKNLNHSSVFVSSSHNTPDIISYAKPAEIYVYARKRPLLSNETNFHDTISIQDNKRVIIEEDKANLDFSPLLKKTEFQFDQVFDSNASNKYVFECTVLPFLSANHHNLTYICFGQTGSGKSHTIFGSKNTDGLLIHCAQLFLQEINLQNKLICSFYEIYNNQVYDLTNTGKRLFVREDGEHHVNIVGLTEINLKNLDTLRSIIYDGLGRRHHGKSAFNSNSSRSHAIFQLILKNSSNSTDYFRLVFIDLAGSERAIDAQNNQRQTRREGAQINSSLLALKECIRSLDMTNSHAPFRQSKLTHILRDSLVGSQTRTCLMANVSPPNDCCQCSLNTLQYASRIRDISIRHRHRSIPTNNVQRNHFDNHEKQQSVGMRDKSQRTFKPATASTPVHRLISSVDHRTYMTTNPTGSDIRRKSPDHHWQLPDDDKPISGSGDNHRIKSVLSSTREFISNTNSKHPNNPSTSFYLTRYEQTKKKSSDHNESVSSYFPQPQTDIKRSSPIQQRNTIAERRVSDSSIEPPSTSRITTHHIPIQVSDDNQYSSTTGTESLGTKITKLATGIHPSRKSNKIENLNLHKQYDTVTTTTVTTDTEQGFYSDRQATHRDQTGFFSNRDDPLYEDDPKSTHLTTITQRTSPTTTPKNLSNNHKSDVLSTSSKKSFSSPTKHYRHRRTKSNSTPTSSSSTNSEKNYHHRIVPYHTHQSSDSEDNKKFSSTRNEACQTINNIQIMKNEQEQTDDQFLLEQFSDQTSKTILQAPLDQVKYLYEQKLLNSSPIVSPSKDYGLRASNQLNSLRTLLERRLMEPDDSINHHTKDLSILQSSPGTFTKEFLQSYQGSKYQNKSVDLVSDLDDDDELNRRRVNFNHGDVLSSSSTSSLTQQHDSTLSDDIKQDKVYSNLTHSTTSTLTNKLDTREPRTLTGSLNGIYSYQSPTKTSKASNSNSDVLGSSSNRTTDSERLSNINSGSQNAYTGSSSDRSATPVSRSRSPLLLFSSHAFDIKTDHNPLLDSGKSSSLLSGTSFDVLVNSLKSMREKDLDYLIPNSDDSLIHVVD